MGKKSRRNNRNTNGGLLRKEELAAVPTAAAAAAATMYETICRFLIADKYDEILKVESKYRHLDTFSDYPPQDVLIFHAFVGCCAHGTMKAQQEESDCMERAIHYFERAKGVIDAMGCIFESCRFVFRGS